MISLLFPKRDIDGYKVASKHAWKSLQVLRNKPPIKSLDVEFYAKVFIFSFFHSLLVLVFY